MRKVLFVLILLGGGMDLAIPVLHAQGTDSTTVVAVLLVQFANQDTCLDCRGSVGYSAPPTLDTVENKYRYGDYWNILFQPTGPVMHPDGDFPDNFSINGRGFDQYGSLRRYIADNSFGLHTVLPYRGWSAWSGLLNTVTPDSSGDPNRAIVDWLTLPYEKSSFAAINHLADSAIIHANRELAVDWDSLDVLIIWFAGVNPYGFAQGSTFGMDTSIGVVHYVITSERSQNDSTGIPTFTYPRVTWHEFCHAAFDADDLHHRFPATGYDISGVGHYSLMGDNSKLGLYTPEMLDPWHRLREGWLRYYAPDRWLDTLTFTTPIDTTNFRLPIVEERYNGEIPWVLAIPIRSHPDSGWTKDGEFGIIIENRRAVGWDSVIVREEMAMDSPTYGLATGSGGFLIWASWYTNQFMKGWVYDADGDFQTWKVKSQYGAPTDLFTGAPGRNTFSLYSTPGVFHVADPGNGSKLLPRSRNVYLEFPTYNDSSTVNPISRVAIDCFIPAAFGYGGSADEDTASTKFTVQQKYSSGDSATLAIHTTFSENESRTFLMSGPSPADLRTVSWLDVAIGETEAVFENGAVAYFPSDSLEGGFCTVGLLEEKQGDEYYVRTWRTSAALDTALHCGNRIWGPFAEPPHPVIANRGVYAALSFRGDDGIYVSSTTNAGCTWSNPGKLTGSAQGSHSPCVLMDTAGANAYLVLFVDASESLWLYRSVVGSSIKVSSDVFQAANLNPSAVRLGNDLAVVYQFTDRTDRKYIARKILELDGDTIPDDWDVFGLAKQSDRDVNRDPAVIFPDRCDPAKTLVYWIFNRGEKLLSASRGGGRDSLVEGLQSVLSGKPTAYPHLLENEAGNPLFVVSRLGSWGGAMAWPDETPSLVVMDRQAELHSNPYLVSFTEIGMQFTSGSDRLMHTQLGTPYIVHAADTVAHIRHDYGASEDFTTQPIDTLTRTRTATLEDGDLVMFTIDVSCHTNAPDTLVIESVLYDPAGMTQVSTSGEMKIAPLTGDTTLVVGIETPNGFPPTDCYVSTSMKRGYFDVDASPEIELVRYMLYDEPAMPKRRARGARVVSRNGTLRIHPQPARGEIRFGIEAEGDGTAILFDLLGRKVIELPLAGDGTTIRGAMGLGSVSPGLYMLVVRTADMVRTGKVIVTR